MHAKTETQSPPSKLTMSLFPNLLHPSTYSTFLDDRQKTRSTCSQHDRKNEHQTAHGVDHYHILAFLVGFLSRMFAPTAYQQCTSTTPFWANPHHSEPASWGDDESVITVDDKFALLGHRESEEQDGGPICREATIESWKAIEKVQRTYGDAGRWSNL